MSIPNVIQPSIISLPPKPYGILNLFINYYNSYFRSLINILTFFRKPDQCYPGKPIITTSQNSK